MDQKLLDDLMEEVLVGMRPLFPGQAIVLLVAPFGADNPTVTFTSNARADGVRALLKEVLQKWPEGQVSD